MSIFIRIYIYICWYVHVLVYYSEGYRRVWQNMGICIGNITTSHIRMRILTSMQVALVLVRVVKSISGLLCKV